jgi:hypothetical protein
MGRIMNHYNSRVQEGIGVFQQHSELTNISKLARDQFNGLKAPGDDECSVSANFLTVEVYKICYLLMLKGSEHWDSVWTGW